MVNRSGGTDSCDRWGLTNNASSSTSIDRNFLAALATFLSLATLPFPTHPAPAAHVPRHDQAPARGNSKASGSTKKKQRQLRRAPSLKQNLPAHVPSKIRADLDQLEQTAAEQGTVVVRLAYRWNGQRACRVDEDGYASIPELLVETHALDPVRPEHLRLTNRALARVVPDVQNSDPPYSSWVDNTNCGDWKKLLASEELQETFDELGQPLANNEPVAVFNQKPFQDTEKDEDDSDYEIDGHPTIRPPPTPRKSVISASPKALLKQGEHSGLTDSDASEGEPSDAEHDVNPSDKPPNDNSHKSSDDEDDDVESGTNDKADKDAAATSVSSLGTESTSSGDDKSSGKSYDKGRDKCSRKTS
ncbi:unnamed protein product [Phytophthora fragariaefolia]|uniref:Unnamed protein product n=1 Tax=Phytophthora fragariaefolia TaxID=1490495 RepID=A0A9W7CSB0_9STRA|nr:unnamed protein product [Phytophthora fragariaefolia]